ncbi:MAG: autotransporter-associated beta strand repeat-containing protein [Akkermansiaceae bacterium]|jgi:autotransporter-associated beta strand protein|nr:autotransporter-associated beta strand repeat-containing protein [Akkermansiaceae bacterium]
MAVISLRNLSGNNTWEGSLLIAETGGSYAIESVSGTLTLGANPTTASVLQNTASATPRPLNLFGAGNYVMNLRVVDNTTFTTGLGHVGTGLLTINRTDNTFAANPSLFSGTTEIASLADSGTNSSLGTGVGITLGGTLRYVGTGGSSNRSLSILQKGATIESNGSGPLALTSTTLSHNAGNGAITSAPFALGQTELDVDNAAGVTLGQSVTGTNIAPGTTITAIDIAARKITLSTPTTAASTVGTVLTIGGANNINRVLTLTGSNTGENSLDAALTNPGGTGTFGIRKEGAGTWWLNGATKTSTGPIDVISGKLGFRNSVPAGFDPGVNSSATLALDNVTLSGLPALQIDGALELAGPVKVELPGNPAPGTYEVLQYGSLSGSGAVTTNYRSSSFSGGATSGSLTVGAGINLTWTGSVSNDWDTAVTNNWQDSGAAPQPFYWLDNVTFNSVGSSFPNVTIPGEVRPNSITVDEDTVDYSFSGAGSITGTGSLVKDGEAKLTISNANTFSGGISILGGTLIAGNNRALGADGQEITVAAGATLDTGGSMNANRDYNITIAGNGVGGNGAIINSGATHNNGFGSITLSANASIGGTNRWDLRPITAGTAEVDLAGFTLTKKGANTVAFVDGTMSAAGDINIDEGALVMTRMTVSGEGEIRVNPTAILRFENYTTGSFAKKTVVDNATVNVIGADFTMGGEVALTNTGTFDLAVGRTMNLGAPVTGTGALSFVSTGTGTPAVLNLLAENTYEGSTTVNAGTLRIGNRTPSGSINTQPVSLLNGGRVQISRSDVYDFPNAISGDGGMYIGTWAAVTEPEWAAMITLSGTNTFTGGIEVYSGGLRIKNAAALGTGPKSVIVGNSNGTNGRPQFYLDGTDGDITLPADVTLLTSNNSLTYPALGNLAGDNVIQGPISLTVGGGSTAVKVIDGSLTLNGTVSAAASGRELILAGNAGANGTINGLVSDGAAPTNVAKDEANTWILSANNTYTGTTIVRGGTLLVNGNQNLATGNVSVNNGVLGGIGTLGGNVTVAAAGTIAPGQSVGTLTTVNSVSSDGSFDFEIDGASADRLVVGGTLEIGGSTLNVAATGAGLTLPVYVIAEAGAPIVGSFAAVNVPAGYQVVVGYDDGVDTFNIALVQSAADPYVSWADGFALLGADRAPDADPDSDGIENGIEFVIGSNPTASTTSGLPAGQVSGGNLIFTFKRSDESEEFDVFVEHGTSLLTWPGQIAIPAGAFSNAEVTVVNNDPGLDDVTVTIPMGTDARKFARLRADIPYTP